MSKNCLFTRLNASIDLEDYEVLDALKVKAKARTVGTNSFFIIAKVSGKSITIKSETIFSVYQINIDTGAITDTLATNVTEYTLSQNVSIKVSIPTDGEYYTYYIVNKRNISRLQNAADNSSSQNSSIKVDITGLYYNDSLSRLQVGDGSTGNLQSLLNTKDALRVITFNTTEIVGSLNDLIQDSILALGIFASKGVSLNFNTLELGKAISRIAGYSNPNFTGEVMTWANKLWAAGKHSGTISLDLYGCACTIDGNAFGNLAKTLTFTNEGVTHN